MKHIIPVVALILACACGDGGGPPSPGGPSVVPPTITTTNTMVYIGQTVQFTATGSGTIRWGGDAPGVATVDAASGRVTGVGSGWVTIWAENEGGRTTKKLRGLPSYAGSWQGSYTIEGCQATGEFSVEHFCDMMQTGQSLYKRYDLSQTADRVTGTFTLGLLIGNLDSMSVAEDGTLPLAGTFADGSTRITLRNGNLESPSAGTIRGQFEQYWTDTTVSGDARVFCRLDSMTRTSGGPSLFQQTAGTATTLQERIRRVLRR